MFLPGTPLEPPRAKMKPIARGSLLFMAAHFYADRLFEGCLCSVCNRQDVLTLCAIDQRYVSVLDASEEVFQLIQVHLVAVGTNKLVESLPLARFRLVALDAVREAIPKQGARISDKTTAPHWRTLNQIEVDVDQAGGQPVFKGDFNHVLHVDFQPAVMASARGGARGEAEQPVGIVERV